MIQPKKSIKKRPCLGAFTLFLQGLFLYFFFILFVFAANLVSLWSKKWIAAIHQKTSIWFTV